jgi:hypothetical protein
MKLRRLNGVMMEDSFMVMDWLRSDARQGGAIQTGRWSSKGTFEAYPSERFGQRKL